MSIRDDLNYGLAAFGIQIPERISVDDWAVKLADKPAQSTATMLSAATILFYLAERGHNPKVRDIYDAAVYCTTNISVGYCDIFAHTPAGKTIGSLLMTLGPALAAKTLDGAKPALDTQQAILATLREIAAKLEASQPPSQAAATSREGTNGHP